MRLSGRLKSLVGAIVSLFIVIGILGYKGAPEENRPVSVPTSEDAGAQGLEGLFRWLQKSGISTLSLRQRFTSLAELDSNYGASGSSLLIMSWPPQQPARANEYEALGEFVRAGNHAVILTAGLDQPKWARSRPSSSRDEQLFDALDLEFSSTRIKSSEDESVTQEDDIPADDASQNPWIDLANFKRAPKTLLSVSKEPVFGVAPEVLTRSYPDSQYDVYVTSSSDHPKLWPVFADAQTGKAAIYRTDRGAGSIWISLFPEIVSNATLGEKQNASFIAQLIMRTVDRNGVVIFNDFHFGLSDIYDESAFYQDSRLHRTLALLGVLWLLWIVGRSTRLAPIRPTSSRPSVKRLIEATGGLYARMLGRGETASALFAHFQRDVRKRLRISDAQGFWPVLTAQLGADHAAVEELKKMSRALDSGRKPSLTKLSRAISIVRRDLATRQSKA